MSGGWEEVPDGGLVAFLEERGLGKHVEKLLEVMEADSVEDLRLLDAAMTERVVEAAGLKIVSGQKFRAAIASLRGEQLEAGTEAAPEAAPAEPEEVVVLCIDRSGSMRASFLEAAAWADQGNHVEQLRRTRMEAVKQMFYAFRDRTEASRRAHALGLLQFDSEIETLLRPTCNLDAFERVVDDMQPRGQTAIYSALCGAVELLAPFAGACGTLRVVALTDGQNNAGAAPESALAALRGVGAVVDAIIVGDQPDANLRRIVAATGGECWQIRDVTEGFELLEAESVVSVAARGGPRPVDADVAFADVQETALVGAGAAKAQRAERAVGRVQDVHVAAARGPSGAGAHLKRAAKELKQVAAGDLGVWLHSGEGVHIFPEEDLAVWNCLLEGPAGSPFESGVFHVSVRLPANYPFSAPAVRFETPVYHCNVSETGQVCLDLLYSAWGPQLTVPKVLEGIRQLLASPDTDNALRQWVAEITLAHAKYGDADTRYVDNAREETLRNASASVEEWKTKWTS